MKRLAATLTAVAAGLALLPPRAQAAPSLEGSMVGGTDFYGFCFQDPGCAPFFAAGCPDLLARPDGLTVSIAPVSSSLWNRTLTFSWEDVNTRAYDAAAPTTGRLTPFGGWINFHFAPSCEMPSGLPRMILGTEPRRRSQAYTIPSGTRWVIAWSMPATADITWRAQ